METQELKYWVALNRFSKAGPIRFKKIYTSFPDLETFWKHATLQDILEAGWEENIAMEFFSRKNEINPENELAIMEKHQVKAITILDSHYPVLLKEIYGAPPIFYYRGSIENLSTYTLAIVGTRKLSPYGQQVTENLVRELAGSGLTIVSGLALGIDTIAHLSAIKHNLETVAVLGSGLDERNIYPSSNRQLAREIMAQNGLLISEYPVGTMPLRYNFPLRNRIISGLSKATLIIEAGESSGALLTANYALEQNREVMAIPGHITSPTSIGTNNLIKQGAKSITKVEDILETFQLPLLTPAPKVPANLSPTENTILQHLTNEPIHIDLLSKQTNLSIQILNSNLSLLEIKGLARNIGNMNFIKSY